MRWSLSVGAALALALSAAPEVSAQLFARRGPNDALVVTTIQGGTLLANTELPDGTTYENGTAIGGSLGFWALRHFGIRGHVATATNDGVQPCGGVFPCASDPDLHYSSAAAHAGKVYVYGAELAMRYPVMNGMLTPYVTAGVGGKSWRWTIPRPTPGRTSRAWSGAAGLELTPTAFQGLGFFERVGIVVEARYHRSKYQWHGLAQVGPCCDFETIGVFGPEPPVVTDYVVTGGLSLHW
jgi:hypothetical protein